MGNVKGEYVLDQVEINTLWELDLMENRHTSAAVRLQTTAKLARKDLTRCARQASE